MNTKVKLVAKHNVSLALKDRWHELSIGNVIYGEIVNDLIKITIDGETGTDIAIYKVSDVSDNFYMTITKG